MVGFNLFKKHEESYFLNEMNVFEFRKNIIIFALTLKFLLWL